MKLKKSQRMISVRDFKKASMKELNLISFMGSLKNHLFNQKKVGFVFICFIEPIVISLSVDTTNGKLDKDELRKYCLEKGFGLVKAEEQVNKLSNKPIGMSNFLLTYVYEANISLRVKTFKDEE